ncbi:hypothetical protein GJ744_010850 [Endocarpon pusillum]|uniref:Uncharacterized protein n=1 Tax=Endocarpon pusillum TaxID=364733 RepID=A0A8H7ADL2_9EURO|nr:hypothetical protein GJ744_010850 [Endocarpon pusillum]
MILASCCMRTANHQCSLILVYGDTLRVLLRCTFVNSGIWKHLEGPLDTEITYFCKDDLVSHLGNLTDKDHLEEFLSRLLEIWNLEMELTMNSQQAQPAIGFQEGLISEQAWMEAHASAPSVTENTSAGIDTDMYCYSRPFSNKHTVKPPEPGRPVKVPKMMKSQSAATQDSWGERARSDPPAEFEVLRQNLESVDAPFDLDASCEDAFTEQLANVHCHYMPDLSLFPLIDEQISTSAHTAVDGSASIDLGVLHAQSSTKDQWAGDQLDEKFLEPYMLSQHPSDSCPQDSAPIQPLSTKLDVSSSSTNPLQTSSLLTEETQPLSIQAARHPPTQYEVVRNYGSGEMLSNSYLDRIRGAVDPAFSNDNWGDEYYFSGSVGFKGLKDIKPPNSHPKIDDIDILEGLQLRAKAIPHRTVEESWNSYYTIVDRVANEDRKGKVQLSSFKGARQGIRRPTMLMDGQSLHGGLPHGIQAQKGTRYRNMMQGVRPAMPVAPSIHSVQFGTAPFIPGSIDSRGNEGLVGDGISDRRNAQLQQRLW